MPSLLERLQALDASVELFRGEKPITTGAIRAAVAHHASVLADREGSLVLLCRSAARHLVGIVTAAVLGRRVIFPAHGGPAYLDEITAPGDTLLTDHDIDHPNQHLLDLPSGAKDQPLRSASDPMVVFFTSGSTSAPKAVAKPWSCLELEGRYLSSLWPLPPGRVEATVSHQHIYGLLYRIVWPVLAGHVASDREAEYWEQLVDRLDERAILVTSPVHLTRMADGLPWAGMRPALITSSGAPLPLAAARDAEVKLGQLPTEVLGSTETGGIAWRQQRATDTPWTPFSGLGLSAGEEGLVVRSPFIGSDRPFAMADRVAFLADGRFRLLGRTDRVVKIEGKRVSLPRVEQVLLELDLVDDAAVVDLPDHNHTLGAVAVLTAAGRAGLAREGAYRFSRRLRQQLAGRLEPMERPKLWRFPATIPVNSQSKRQVSRIRAMFAAPPEVLPPSQLLQQSDTEAEIALDLEPQLIWFQGHFPGFAILPGVAQIHLARLFAARLWRFEPKTGHLSRVKFRKLMQPGQRVHLHLWRDVAKDTVRFRFASDGAAASEGVIGQG
ncbi:MAG: AMP-binding protein [Pseudomonadota bacterium]